LRDYGLRWMHGSARELEEMEPERRERILAFVQDHGLGIIPAIWGWLEATPESLAQEVDLILKWAEPMNAPIVHTGVASVHRFLKEPSLEFQMDCLARLMPEVVERLGEKGLPLAIENHGDYYVSDLVSLIERVPGLKIFLDTGNTFLIGEKPLPAFLEAAPYVVGGHFKDHVVGPVASDGPLRFTIGASVIGEGHVPLRECFDIIQEHTPNPESVAMLIELIPPSFEGNDNVVAFEKSVDFVKSLEGARG
jgi:sugar phosphate isomerase/epimerase